MQAERAAGGIRDRRLLALAQPASVILIRKVNDTERIAVRIDLSESVASAAQDIVLTSDDVVFVPKSAIGKWNKVVTQYVQMPFPCSCSTARIRSSTHR